MTGRGQPSAGSVPEAPALFAVECPGCHAHLAAAAALAGGAAACPLCRAPFLVPDAAPAAPLDAPVVLAEPPLPTTRERPDDAFVVVEPAAVAPATDADRFVFREPQGPTAGGAAGVTIRRSTSSSGRGRRFARDLVLLVAGAALLVALVVLLATRGR